MRAWLSELDARRDARPKSYAQRPRSPERRCTVDVPQSTGLANGWRDSTITSSGRIDRSGLSSSCLVVPRQDSGPLSSDRGLQRSATKCCIGFRFFGGPWTVTRSVPNAWWRCPEAARRRGTTASHAHTSKSSIWSSRQNLQRTRPHVEAGRPEAADTVEFRSRTDCAWPPAGSALRARACGIRDSCTSCSGHFGTVIARVTFCSATRIFGIPETAAASPASCRCQVSMWR